MRRHPGAGEPAERTHDESERGGTGGAALDSSARDLFFSAIRDPVGGRVGEVVPKLAIDSSSAARTALAVCCRV
jgi:hypothetical protein